MTLLYIASGSGFERLTRYMILGYLPFYGLVALAAIRLRRRQLPAPGQYSMPWYPLPIAGMLLYVVGGLASGLLGDPVAALGGTLILVVGAAVFEGWRRTAKPA